jgi:hypothetical protein
MTLPSHFSPLLLDYIRVMDVMTADISQKRRFYASFQRNISQSVKVVSDRRAVVGVSAAEGIQ